MAAPISEQSKKCYLRNLRTLTTKVVPGHSIEEVIQHADTSIAQIQKKYENTQTRKAMAAAIKALFKHVPSLKTKFPTQADAWNAFHAAQDRIISTKVMNSEMSERERANWVEWADVIAKQRALARDAYGSDEHLLLSMYTLIEPLRQDFGNVAVIPAMPRNMSDLGEGNHIAIPEQGPGTLVLSKYKTQGAYGIYTRDIPAELADVIRASLRRKPRGWLFVGARGKPFPLHTFTIYSNKLLQTIFGKKVTVTTLRHSFISNIDFNQSTPSQLMRTSRNMAHSLIQQQLYRRRPDVAPPPGNGVHMLTQSETSASPPLEPPAVVAAPPSPRRSIKRRPNRPKSKARRPDRGKGKSPKGRAERVLTIPM